MIFSLRPGGLQLQHHAGRGSQESGLAVHLPGETWTTDEHSFGFGVLLFALSPKEAENEETETEPKQKRHQHVALLKRSSTHQFMRSRRATAAG